MDQHKPHSTTTHTSCVRALSHKGHGVVDHPDGRVFFVKGSWPGDEITWSVEADTPSYEAARFVQLVKAAPVRVSVPCPHQGGSDHHCGGCPWMMVEYSAQLAAKEQRVKFLLSKNGITPLKQEPIIASEDVLGYRNRAQFKTDGVQVGYVAEGTNKLVPIQDCLILNAPMRSLLQEIRKKLPSKEWSPTEPHPWSYLDVDDQQNPSELVANRRRPFRQGNEKQNQKMKAWIMSVLEGVRRDYPVLEAFCGSGNFTEALSQAGFTNIVAAEVRGSALQELRAKELPGVRVMEIDMTEKGVWQQLAKRQPHAKILLVDPPREGMEKRRGLFKYLDNLERVIYISCEPTTWARDVKDFQQNGWRVETLVPLDMFPHTPHVEILSVLRRS